MKYVAIHLQTGGIDSEHNSLLELGAIVEDTNNLLSFEETPKFRALIEHEFYRGEPYALHFNAELFRQLSLPEAQRTQQVIHYDNLAVRFFEWLTEHVKTKVINNINNIFKGDLDTKMIVNTENVYTRKKLLINVAGKNFGVFQQTFLKKIPKFSQFITMHHRILDPGILFLDMHNDEFMPDTNECKKRANISNREGKLNNTLEECWDTIMLIRKGKKL